MSNHVKIFAKCDFSLRRRQRHKTYTYHDIRFLPLGRRSAIAIGQEMVLHFVSFRQSRRSSPLALYSHREHHWKRGTRVLQHVRLSQQIDPNRREDHILGQQQHQFSIIEWTRVTFEMLLWLSLSVLRRVGAPMLSSKKVMCVALIPDILSYGKMLSMTSHTHFPSITSCYLMYVSCSVSERSNISYYPLPWTCDMCALCCVLN